MHWAFDERLKGEDGLSPENAIPPIGKGETAAPLALPVTKGDRIDIEYPDGSDESFHFVRLQDDTVVLVPPEVHENEAVGNTYRPHHVVREGIYKFNKRLIEKADSVTVTEVDLDD